MSDAQRNKRRASGRHEDEPAKKKGRPTKAVQTSQAPSIAMNRVQARRLVEENKSLKEPSDASREELLAFYRGIISWNVGSQWGPEDAIDEEWDQSVQKAKSKVFKPSQHGALLTMFKVCLRLYHSTPIDIISPYHGLRYHPASPNGQGNPWVYNKTFCDEFTALMVHPFWELNTDLLGTALQWTVICRIRDDRLWHVRLDKYCPALDFVYEEVQRCEENNVALPCSYHEIHVSERQRILETEESPGEWSDLFYQIGELASEETAAKPDDEWLRLFDLPVLPVTIQDVRLLTKALNSTELRREWNYSVKEAMEGWNAEVSGQDLPSMRKLPIVFEAAWKSVFQYVRVTKREYERETPSTSSGNDETRNPDPSSDDGETQVEASSSHDESSRLTVVEGSRRRQIRRRQLLVDDSSDEEYVGLRRTIDRLPLIRHGRDANDAEEDGTSPVLPEEHEPYPLQGVESEEGDRGGMTNTFDDSVGPDFGELDLQNTNESPEFRPHGPTLAESFPSERHASPVYASLREKKMLSELSELRKENKELRDGQKRLQDLFAKGIKEQNDLMQKGQKDQRELMLTMKQQLDNMRSELTQLRQARQAPGDVVQSHPERPSLPEATVIVSRSPELGTNQSPPPLDDVTMSEEVADDRPMEEDIAPEQPVPKQKTPEPERSEQPATNAQEQATEPDSNINPAVADEDRTQAVSQLPGTIAETSSTNAEARASEQSSAPPPWPVLPLNPPMPRRNIPRLAWTGAGRFHARSDAHDVFVTPRSKVLKILKGYE